MSTKANTVFEQVKAAMESDPARSKSDVFKQIAEDTGRSLSAVRANFYQGAHAAGEELLPRGVRKRTNGGDPVKEPAAKPVRRRRQSVAAQKIAEAPVKTDKIQPTDPRTYGVEIQAARDAIEKLERIIKDQNAKLIAARGALD